METSIHVGPGRYRRWRRVFPVMALIGAVLGLGVGAVVTYFQPKVYQAFVMLEAIPNVHLKPFSPSFSETQFNLIQSDQVLGLAADRLNLTLLWKCRRNEAIRRLGGLMKADFMSGTDLLIIKVRHPDRELVAEMANAVADAYCKTRDDEDRRMVELRLQELRKPVRTQEEMRAVLTIIHKRAVVPEHPVPPNTFMNLLLGAGLGLLGFSVLAWPVMARMHRHFPTQPSA